MQEKNYPALYRASNQASMNAQRRYLTSVKVYSWCSIISAGLGVYGIQEKNAAIIAALLGGITDVVKASFLAEFLLKA